MPPVSFRSSELPERMSVLFQAPRRFRRAIGRIAAALGLAVVFTSALGVAAFLHLDMAPTRRVARRVTSSLLGTMFAGTIKVGVIDRLSYDAVEIRDAEILDPEGLQVIRAHRVVAHFSTLHLLRSLFVDNGPGDPLWIAFGRIQIEDATVTLIPTEGSPGPSIGRAFLLRTPPAPSTGPSRPLILTLPRIELAHVDVNGEVGRPLDATVQHLVGSVAFSDGVVSVDVNPTGIVERAYLPATVEGTAGYHLRVDTDAVRVARTIVTDADGTARRKDPVDMWMEFNGRLGAIPVQSSAEIEGTHIAAKAELPRITPEALHAIFPPVPLVRSVSASVRASGSLPDLSVTTSVHMREGRRAGSLTADGRLNIAGAPRLEVQFQSNEIDPRDLFKALPEARVTGKGVFRLGVAPDGILGSLELSTGATTIGGTPIPAIDLVADLRGDQLIGSAALDEPGAPIDTRFTIDGAGRIAFGVRVDSEDLTAATRLTTLLHFPLVGGAIASATGAFDQGHITADLVASGGGIVSGPFSAGRAYVSGHVEGPLDKLTGRAHVEVQDSQIDGQKVDSAKLDLEGPVLQPSVHVAIDDSDLGKLDGHAAVNVTERIATGIEFKVERGGTTAEGKVQQVSATGGSVDVRGVEIHGEGLGKISGGLHVESGDLVGTIQAEGIQISKVSSLLGLPVQAGGIANLDVALERTPTGRKGHVELEVQDGEYSLLSGIAARLSAKFDGDTFESAGYVRLVSKASDEDRKLASTSGVIAQAELCDGPIAEVVVSDATGKLPGPLLSPATWQRATGDATLSADNVNLRCVMALIPRPVRSFLPLSDASGLLSTHMHVGRKEGDPYPSLRDGYVRTHGLELVGPAGLLGTGKPDWESRRVDVALTAGLDGTTGATTAHATFFDGTLLAELSGEMGIDLGRAIEAWNQPGGLALELEKSPIDLHFEVPRRMFTEMQTLPSFLASLVPALDGDVGIDASLQGTLAAPQVYANVQGYHLRALARDESPYGWVPTLDADIAASYSPTTSRAKIEAHFNHAGATVASVNAGVDVAASSILHPTAGPLPWKAGFFLTIYDFPLETITPLADRDVSGHVTGTLAVSGINDVPSISLRMSAPELKLGDATFDALLQGSVKPSSPTPDPAHPLGDASLRLTLDGGASGVFDALATAGLDGFALDATRPGDVDARLDAFDLTAFTPAVAPALSRLAGTVDGEVVLHQDHCDLAHLEDGRLVFPTPQPAANAKPGAKRRAGLTVRDAIVLVPQLGQELKDGSATITAEPGADPADTLVVVKDLTLHGSSGALKAALEAKFHGLAFQNATGTISIARGEEIPVTFEGVPLGNASGQISFTATHPEGAFDIHVTVPVVHFDLPESSSRNVQDLGVDGTIHTNELLTAPEPPRAANATRYHMQVDLARGEVSGGFDAVVHSAPTAPIMVDLADRLTVGGDIIVDSASVVLQKKKFEADRGLIRLRPEDASNPYINASAHWEGPDGGRVYVDFVGDLKPITDDKIRFRSDPPRSKEDIIATLLFGTDLSSTPTSGAPTVATTTAGTAADTQGGGVGSIAAGVTSTIASQALKSLVSSKYFTISVDTTSDGSVRGSVEWHGSQGLTLGISGEQVQAQTATASTGSQVAGAQGELSLEWKFLPNWSLRSSFGAGVREPSTGVDLLWQYNY